MYHTRIAPSPTGDLHIGTARTAYFNWLAAKASGGTFTLRIDDTDQKRNDENSVKVIHDIMDWLGLNSDRTFRQSDRFARHKEVVERVSTVQNNRDTAVRLWLEDADRANFPRVWHDEVIGDVKITDDDLNRMQDMVLIKSDGTPTYNWSSVVDDMDMGINYILRGTDHITNTSKQVVLFHLLGTPIPKFAHVGLISQGGKLLSKSEGSTSMMHYKNAGYDPDAMLQFLARLGWAPKVDDKSANHLPRERMVELFFAGGKLKSNQANMDLAKLESLDRKYKAAKGVWRTGEKLM
jgi:glutamyl/glutaminyl-tRNA synthetase